MYRQVSLSTRGNLRTHTAPFWRGPQQSTQSPNKLLQQPPAAPRASASARVTAKKAMPPPRHRPRKARSSKEPRPSDRLRRRAPASEPSRAGRGGEWQRSATAAAVAVAVGVPARTRTGRAAARRGLRCRWRCVCAEPKLVGCCCPSCVPVWQSSTAEVVSPAMLVLRYVERVVCSGLLGNASISVGARTGSEGVCLSACDVPPQLL